MNDLNPNQGIQETGASIPAQPTRQNEQATSAEPESFAKKTVRSAVGGAFAGTFRGLVSWAHEIIGGDDGGTDV
ncbi:hypothetical protein ACFYRY_42090 [Streptomyces sp. NPDC005263]|uniref:hypothetical protein n=1 Tax=Streptomyces sp. NPDC005263 TaxID=3364711 RepID=UPI0036BA8650